ncbi:MAG: hypothetical protein L0I76_28170 [Pseudonocardia sp.]|nr:hypothetical protein [Pseudonocardia sp.]
MSPLPTRAAAAIAVLLCSGFLLAGCTGAPEPPAPAGASGVDAAAEPGQAVGDAAVRTIRAGSARADVVVESAIGPVRATGPIRFEPFAADLTATVGEREVALRAVDGKAWARLGTRWQPLSPGLVPVGAVAGALRSVTGLRDVVEVGPETIGGVPATLYRGSVDLSAVPAPDATAKAEIAELSALASPTPRIEVWIGPDGTVAQLRTASVAPTAPQAASAPTPGVVTVSLTDLGVPVEVTPPPTG